MPRPLFLVGTLLELAAGWKFSPTGQTFLSCMMLVSHAMDLDETRGEATLPPTPPVDTSDVLIEAVKESHSPRSCPSAPRSTVSKTEDTKKQNAIRASSLTVSGDVDGTSRVTWRGHGEQPFMREPHISTLYEKDDVMAKHFGVTQKQALRTQALLRLGVTEEDVKIAERLLASRLVGDTVSLLLTGAYPCKVRGCGAYS